MSTDDSGNNSSSAALVPAIVEDVGRDGSGGSSSSAEAVEKNKEKTRVSKTSLIHWYTHQNDVAGVRKLLREDPTLVTARDYDSRTPLHVASLHGWIDVAKCLIECRADINALDRWKNTVRT